MCRWPFIRKSGDDMGTFSKVSTSRACVRGAAVCDKGTQVLSEGPRRAPPAFFAPCRSLREPSVVVHLGE